MNSKVLSHTKEGIIEISIKDKIYLYLIDSVYLSTFLYWHSKNKGRAIKFIKQKARYCRRK